MAADPVPAADGHPDCDAYPVSDADPQPDVHADGHTDRFGYPDAHRHLDQHPDVVLAYTQAKAIDDKGEIVKVYPGKHHFNSPDPRERFYEFVLDPHPVVAVFGLMRRDVLGRTRLIGKYAGSDRPLLSELSLLGKFHEVPEHLFFYRFHEEQSWGGKKSAQAQQAWYDPRRAGKVSFPQWRLLREHVRSIERSPVGFKERASCYLYMGYWMAKNRRRLGRNLLLRDA